MPTPVIIDCDPGHDDAMALMLAVASPELELAAVTTVAGNQTLDKVTANAIRVLDVARRTDIPVAAGARPRARPPGRDGRATCTARPGSTAPTCRRPSRAPEPLHAVELIAARAARAPADARSPVGPLTNIALLLAVHPELTGRIERLVIMGGAIGAGNVTPSGRVQHLGRPGGRQARLRARIST